MSETFHRLLFIAVVMLSCFINKLNKIKMIQEIKTIVDAIKINIEIAKVDGKPLIAEVSMNDKSKEYIAKLIEEYGNICYLDGKYDASNLHEA